LLVSSSLEPDQPVVAVATGAETTVTIAGSDVTVGSGLIDQFDIESATPTPSTVPSTESDAGLGSLHTIQVSGLTNGNQYTIGVRSILTTSGASCLNGKIKSDVTYYNVCTSN